MSATAEQKINFSFVCPNLHLLLMFFLRVCIHYHTSFCWYSVWREIRNDSFDNFTCISVNKGHVLLKTICGQTTWFFYFPLDSDILDEFSSAKAGACGVCSTSKYTTAYEESLTNRSSNFLYFMRSAFPRATFIDFIWLEYLRLY